MKYPRTRQGMARRKADGLKTRSQFNPHNGEPHTKRWLDAERKLGLRRMR